MFGLIRRISYSVIPRPDRPWEEDPTSNAPTRRKRRISSTEPETSDEQEQQGKKKKKIRGDSEGKDDHPDPITTEQNGGDSTTTTPDDDGDEDAVQREGSLEVKSVTEGVKEVELDDKPDVTEGTTTTANSHPETADDEETQPAGAGVESATSITEGVHPESIPLPEEDDESDDLASSSPSPITKEEEEEEEVSPDETTTPNTLIETSTVTEESTTIPSSPGKRPHTTSPRKSAPSQSPQKLFTTV